MKKSILMPILFLFLANVSSGQFFKSILPAGDFSNALEKIVLDFRDNYKNIEGEKLDKLGEVDVYASLITLPGTNECKIMRYHSLLDTTAGWQAIVYEGEDQGTAVKAYQNIFRQVKKSKIKWIDMSSVGFRGDMETPRSEIRFTTSTLRLDSDDRRYKDFEAQIEFLSTYTGFVVQLSLHKKTKENLF